MLREDECYERMNVRMKFRGPHLGPYNIIPSFYDEMKLIEGKYDNMTCVHFLAKTVDKMLKIDHYDIIFGCWKRQLLSNYSPFLCIAKVVQFLPTPQLTVSLPAIKILYVVYNN